jgi:hypothetical protein
VKIQKIATQGTKSFIVANPLQQLGQYYLGDCNVFFADNQLFELSGFFGIAALKKVYPDA